MAKLCREPLLLETKSRKYILNILKVGGKRWKGIREKRLDYEEKETRVDLTDDDVVDTIV